MSKLLSGFMQKMHLNDNEYPDDFDDTEELDDEPEDDEAQEAFLRGNADKKEKKGIFGGRSQKKKENKRTFAARTSTGEYDDIDDDDDIDDLEDTAPARKTAAARQTAPRARSSRVVSMNRGRSTDTRRSYYNSMEVCILKPIDIDSAEEICDAVIDGKAVIVNMDNIDTATRQRIVDMVSGATYAIEGDVKLLSDIIAVFTPKNIDITGDLEEYASGSISLPSLGSAIIEDE